MSLNESSDILFMGEALKLCQNALERDEVPVAAIVVLERDPKTQNLLEEPIVVGRGFNTKESEFNPLGHAELTAIKEASITLGRWRLSGCVMYVTLEPCLMCAGALISSRIDRLVYGATDPKAGAVASLFETLKDKRLNHQVPTISGVLEKECGQILKTFFVQKRISKLDYSGKSDAHN